MAARRKKKKKATKRKARRKAPAMESVLVTSKVKNALREQNVNVASDAVDSLNMMVHWYIDQAVKRAMSNGRKTVRGHDFMAG